MKKFCLLFLILSSFTIAQNVWINEIDADQTSTDTNEFIELVGIGGLDITGYTIILYNGTDTTPPNDYLIQTISSFTFSDELNGYGFFVLGSDNISARDQVLGGGVSNLIQNGPPDGVALFDNSNNLVFKFAYGGTLTGSAVGYPDVDFSISRCAVDGTTTSMGFLINSKPLDSEPGQNNLTPTPGTSNTDGITNQTLPVELSSFSASVRDSKVKLNWATATEVNNFGFEVQRMSNVKGQTTNEWQKIGFVNGNGNSNSPKSYSFTDNDVTFGKYNYRLKQIDNDGTFEYSKTVEADLGAPKEFGLNQNYPNPFNPTTTISYNLPEASNVKLTLYNLLGQEVKLLVDEFKEAGAHTANFNAENLDSGVYIYKLQAGSFTQTRKMTLIK